MTLLWKDLLIIEHVLPLSNFLILDSENRVVNKTKICPCSYETFISSDKSHQYMVK